MIKIIDYKAGNAPSVFHALTYLGHKAEFARGPEDIANASRIILPGVGNAQATMDSLEELRLLSPLEQAVRGKKKIPFLGICVGMQVLFEYSEEGGNVKCFGWLPGRIIRYDAQKVRVPQMGWNKVKFIKDTNIFADEDYFYFVNSYYAEADYNDIWGEADYGGTFTAAVNRGNIYGTQFHVEKSGEAGLKLLDDFVRWG